MANPFIKKGAKKGALARLISGESRSKKSNKVKPKGYYTMAELKKMKEEKKKKSEAARKKARNTRIIKSAQAKQTAGNKSTPSSKLPQTTTIKKSTASKPSSRKPRATRKKTTGVAVTRKGVSIKPITGPSGAKITKRATTKTDKQKKAAQKGADIRKKGMDAMKAGKLGKARRLSRRYQNQKKKM